MACHLKNEHLMSEHNTDKQPLAIQFPNVSDSALSQLSANVQKQQMTPFVHSLEKKDYMFKTWNLASRAIRGPKSQCMYNHRTTKMVETFSYATLALNLSKKN